MDSIQLTRKELYDLVWSQPMTTVAKKLNRSDNGVRKICKRFEIPMPEARYWSKRQYFKQTNSKPFLAKFKGLNIITIAPPAQNNEVRTFTRAASAIKNRQQEIKADIEKNQVFVATPLPEVTTIKRYTAFKEIDSNYKITRKDLTRKLNPLVSASLINRAVDIMSTLINALTIRGHKLELRTKYADIIIYGVKIQVKLFELKKRIPKVNTRFQEYTFIPSGLLSFNTYERVQKRWSDGKIPLESQIPKIIAWLEFEGERLKIINEAYQKRHEEAERIKQIEIALRARKDKELNDFRTLLNDAHRWKNAVILKEYLKYIERHVTQFTSSSDFTPEWLTWAKAKADWYDPMVNSNDELLEGFDRNEI